MASKPDDRDHDPPVDVRTTAVDNETRLLRHLLDDTPFAVYLVDLEGTIVAANRRGAQHLGRSQDQIIGTCIRDYFPPEVAARRKAWGGQVLKTGKAMTVEDQLGGRCFISTISPVFDEQGTPTHFAIYGVDITEQKEMEAQLQQSRRMEAIGTLAGGVAHDFNNLLMGIQGNASLILGALQPDDPLVEQVRTIEDCVKSAQALTNQLLGFSRPSRSRSEPVALNRVIERTAALFGRTHRDVTTRLQLEPGLWVNADSRQLEQVMLNLCVNASQAMPQGGILHIDAKSETLGEAQVAPFGTPAGRYVTVQVTDTGLGMAEQVRRRAFEPFFTTKDPGRGTGLGLSTVYGIIQNHDGFITVESELGAGSTFRFCLPAVDARPARVAAAPSRLARGDETILLVDDEQCIVDAVTQMLKALGYRVLAARSGEEAIETYRQHHQEIDLVILDAIMPGIGGSRAFAEMRAIDPDVRVILCSGYDSSDAATGIAEQGSRGFLQKPFGFEELSRKVRQVLDQD